MKSRRGPVKGSRRRVFEEVRDQIREQILSGVLKEGDKLPAERDIEGQLGFSRSAVREAFRALEAAGLLELKKGVHGGAFIRRPDGQAVARSMSDAFLLGKIPLRDITEMRLILLPRAAMLACVRATQDDLDALSANIEATEQAIRNGVTTANHVASFYKLIGAATKNDMLSRMIDATTDVVLSAFATARGTFTQDLLDKRKVVLEALIARDRDALAESVVRLILYAHETVSRALQAKYKLSEAVEEGPESIPEEMFDFRPPASAGPDSAGARSADPNLERILDENTRLKMLLAEVMLEASDYKRRLRALDRTP